MSTKNPIAGHPIVAGYNWILMLASIFVGFYIKSFYSKLENIGQFKPHKIAGKNQNS